MGNLRDKYTNEEWNELEKKVEQDSKSIEDLWFSILFGEAPEPNQALKDAAESYKEQKTKTCTGQCKNCTCKKVAQEGTNEEWQWDEPTITRAPCKKDRFQIYTDKDGVNWKREIKENDTYGPWIRQGSTTKFQVEEEAGEGLKERMDALLEIKYAQDDVEKTSKEMYSDLAKIDEAGVWSPTRINNEFLKEGQKESNNKLSYELDWDFIQAMAERMQNNKKKYPSGNWKKPIDVELLKQSLFRHVIEVMKGNYEDDDRLYGHLEAIALNSMFINYQLSNAK